MTAFLRRAFAARAACAGFAALAGLAAPGAEDEVEEIVVVAAAPGDQGGIAAARLPYAAQTLDSEAIARTHSLDVSELMTRGLASVTRRDAQSNPLQADISYRGYTASPLLGLAQGISVHVDGARFNEPLGDTVNWDLIPVSAIHSLQLMGGASPVFGLNTLGGSLSLRTKNGFNSPGMGLEAWGGSHGRAVVAAETGATRSDGSLGYHLGVHAFDEDGWRDLSASRATNVFGSAGWRGDRSAINARAHRAVSNLLGNGAAPVELLARDRTAIFTAPDRTENAMTMLAVDASHALSERWQVAANAFRRSGNTDAFNGDAGEYAVCSLGGGQRLLEGLEDDDLEELGIDDEDVCDGRFGDAGTLEDFLNDATGEDDEFDLEDLTATVSGSGELADDAVNNISRRRQTSSGIDAHATYDGAIGNVPARLIGGAAWYRGDTAFLSVTELSALDPLTRSTEGLGTGAFVDGEATSIDTRTETISLYATGSADVTDALTLTVSARMNRTRVTLQDRSGERPELDGEHTFTRVNPHAGAVWRIGDAVDVYAGAGLSSRAPTPIELACNEYVFARAADAGDDDFECRLPNAFLADPPLDDVVTRAAEAGVRGRVGGIAWHLGLFRSINRDDILFQTTGRATGLFANVDETRRSGLELLLHQSAGRLDWSLAYTRLDATFGQDFTALSPNHPHAGDDGEIAVDAGSRIPGLPARTVKLSIDYGLGRGFAVGVDLVANGAQRLRGDEANTLDALDGYALVDLRADWQVSPNALLFLRLENALGRDYESFGLIAEEPSELDVPAFADFGDPRFASPGAPRGIFAGVRLRLSN